MIVTLGDFFANKPNVIIFITDQERALSEWPLKFQPKLARRLKAMKRLKGSGLSFEKAYTAACMCSPSRATFQTSQYPIVTGCTHTGPTAQALPSPSPTRFANLASVFQKAGYTSYWIGKWHLFQGVNGSGGGPVEPGTTSSDLSQWGYEPYTNGKGTTVAWDFPDAGITLDDTYLGGGTKGSATSNRNDHRYVTDACKFLEDPPPGPWCLVVSLVNPHDSHLGYLNQAQEFYNSTVYNKWTVNLPGDWNENPATMPRAQSYGTWNALNENGANMQDFANFYPFLVERADRHIGKVLDAMTENQINESLIVRFSDHGEMGLAHGLIEKFTNAYSQTMHVPLVFSNPTVWPAAQATDALASTVDIVPTFASLLGVSLDFLPDTFTGTDLSPVLNGIATSVQDYVHFTYDDETFQTNPPPPSVIRAIRSADWLYAVYLDSVGSTTSGFSDADWEMYDLRKDKTETVNLAGTGLPEQAILDQALQQHMVQKNTAPAWLYTGHWPPQKTSSSIGGPPPGNGSASRPLVKKG